MIAPTRDMNGVHIFRPTNARRTPMRARTPPRTVRIAGSRVATGRNDEGARLKALRCGSRGHDSKSAPKCPNRNTNAFQNVLVVGLPMPPGVTGLGAVGEGRGPEPRTKGRIVVLVAGV